MDRHGQDDLVDVGRHFVQFDRDGLVVAVAGAGGVVARVNDRTVDRFQVVVEDEVSVAADLAGSVDEEDGTVQVERGAVGGARVPAEADDHFGQARGFFAQVDVTAFLQTDSHDVNLQVSKTIFKGNEHRVVRNAANWCSSVRRGILYTFRAASCLRWRSEDHSEATMKATPIKPVNSSGTWYFMLASMIKARIPMA